MQQGPTPVLRNGVMGREHGGSKPAICSAFSESPVARMPSKPILAPFPQDPHRSGLRSSGPAGPSSPGCPPFLP